MPEPEVLPDVPADPVCTINLTDMDMPTDTDVPFETDMPPFETADMPIESTLGGSGNLKIAHIEEFRKDATEITGVGQTFTTFTAFREALKKYSIAHGFNFKYKKNETHRVTVVCKSQGCPWRIHVSRLATTHLVSIKTMTSKHTCEESATKPDRATRSWIGSIIREKLKISPDYKPKDIAIDMKREYGIELNYSQAFRAKESAMEQLHGSFKHAYSQLPLYCEKIMESNPGSIATFTTNEDSSFRGLFVSFYASIYGFQQGCRPLIFLNSFPLYSKYQGTLLVATAADGNDAVFPVAFAVVDEGTDENWHWFLSELKSAVSTVRKLTFIADFEKGIRESLHQIFCGECYHGYCLCHLAERLNKNLKGQFTHEARCLLVKELYAAAYAPKLEAFERCAAKIKVISPDAYNWVIRSEPDHWANAFFGGARYNHMTSNFGELFYSWVTEATELPITHLVDVLRGKITEMIYTRRAESNQWETTLTPSMEEKLKNETLKAGPLQVLLSHGNTFEVRGECVDVVDVDHWDCSCKGWQLSGLPCSHAIAVFECIGRSPYDYCSRFFMVESYRLTYAESIQSVPNVEKPLKSELTKAPITVTPPPTRRPPGRPKTKQDGEQEVIKHKLQCSKCKSLGHNKRSCK